MENGYELQRARKFKILRLPGFTPRPSKVRVWWDRVISTPIPRRTQPCVNRRHRSGGRGGRRGCLKWRRHLRGSHRFRRLVGSFAKSSRSSSDHASTGGRPQGSKTSSTWSSKWSSSSSSDWSENWQGDKDAGDDQPDLVLVGEGEASRRWGLLDGGGEHLDGDKEGDLGLFSGAAGLSSFWEIATSDWVIAKIDCVISGCWGGGGGFASFRAATNVAMSNTGGTFGVGCGCGWLARVRTGGGATGPLPPDHDPESLNALPAQTISPCFLADHRECHPLQSPLRTGPHRGHPPVDPLRVRGTRGLSSERRLPPGLRHMTSRQPLLEYAQPMEILLLRELPQVRWSPQM